MNATRGQRSRIFRMQFSLRTILLVMFLLGAGMVVYRWPWEETRPGDSQLVSVWGERKTVTTWRRGWFGGQVKDGPECKSLNGDLVEEVFYSEGQLQGRCRSFHWHNHITEERNFRGGVLHGPYRIGDGETWVYEGQYDRGLRDGSWRVLTGWDGLEQDSFALADHGIYISGSGDEPRYRLDVPPEAIEVRQQWLSGRRHGHWEWRTLEGELINAAEYSDNQLSRWNGEDAPEQFWNRVRELLQERDPVLLTLLEQPAGDLTQNSEVRRRGRRSKIIQIPRTKTTDFVIGGRQPNDQPPNEERVIHFVAPPTTNPFQHAENSIGSNLLEFALFEGLAVEFRFGGLWFVPADEASGFRDAPGADRIVFDRGSLQEASWAEVIPFDQEVSLNLSSIQRMLSKTAIDSFFTEGLDKDQYPLLFGGGTSILSNVLPSRRMRGDVIGLVLYRENASCELRDNVLVVKPHWSKGLIEPRSNEDSTDDSGRGHRE